MSARTTIRGLIVGDTGVGKSSLANAYVHPKQYHKNSKDKVLPRWRLLDRSILRAQLRINGVRANLDVIDYSGPLLDRIDGYYSLSADQANFILICFSIASKDSLANVHNRWLSKIRVEYPDKPVILVGTMSDYRQRPSKQHHPLVSFEEGQNAAEAIGAVAYVECSSWTSAGVLGVFDEAVLAAVKADPSLCPLKRICNIL